jgi:Zn finger protein HypA/HybF involved in hydrogenase expression
MTPNVHMRDENGLFMCKTNGQDWSSYKWREVTCPECLKQRPS